MWLKINLFNSKDFITKIQLKPLKNLIDDKATKKKTFKNLTGNFISLISRVKTFD